MRRTRSVVQTLLEPGDRVDPRVDAVELRLDLYPGLDVAAFVRACAHPVVATVRRAADGGRFDGSAAERRALLAGAATAAWVDVEHDAPEDYAPAGPRRIVSHHDTAGMPEDLDALFEKCLLRGGDRVKIAATPASADQAFRLLDLPTGGLGLGSWGRFTRVLAPLTYCGRAEAAPGMPTPEELLDLYGVRRLGVAPALYGVAGDPIDGSESPLLHNPALARDGLDAVYLPFRVTRLAPFLDAFRGHGGRGLSVTAPLKLDAAALASAPDDDVRESGAANTLLADGRAFNTDVAAFLELVPPGGGAALVLGAGGAARAAVTALRRLGYAVRVWNRTRERAAALGVPVADRPEPSPVVVNTIPRDPPPAPFLVDLRYGPGIDPPPNGIDGRTFLRAQARHQYRIFTGHEL